MSDQGAHEIQLSGKQLVFLFMSGVVLLVVVFLLGVSVGRGVAPEVAVADAGSAPIDEPAGTDTEVAMSAAAEPAPGDLSYDRVLTGRDANAAEPPASPPPPSEPPRETKPPPSPPPAPPAAEPVAEPAAPAPQPGAGWVVQVGAFRSKANADRAVAQLASKGFTATISPAGSLLRVRVGPYAERAEADGVLASIRKQGLSGTVQPEGRQP